MQKKLYTLTLALLIVPAYITAQAQSNTNARQSLMNIQQEFNRLQHAVTQTEAEAPRLKQAALLRLNAIQKKLIALTNKIAEAKITAARETALYKSSKKGAEFENARNTEQEFDMLIKRLREFNRRISTATQKAARLSTEYPSRKQELKSPRIARRPVSKSSLYGQQ